VESKKQHPVQKAVVKHRVLCAPSPSNRQSQVKAMQACNSNVSIRRRRNEAVSNTTMLMSQLSTKEDHKYLDEYNSAK